MIGGDFNTVLNESIDRWPPGRRSNSNTALKDFMHRLELVDIWRVKNANDQEFTWSNKKLSSLSRIDFWLVSRNLDKDYIHVDISTTPLTDHKAVSIKIMFSPEARFNKGSSYWKMNSSLLKRNEVKSELERLIHFYWNKAKQKDSFGLNWELLKYEIGKYLRKCSGNLAKLKRLEEANIVSEISFITKILPENLSDIQRTCLVDLQIKLDDLYKLRAEGAFIRSRQRWLEHGEQMSSYFFKLEKNRAKHNSICQLNIGGVLPENPKEISQFCYRFYSNLYKSKCNQADLDTFSKHLGIVNIISHRAGSRHGQGWAKRAEIFAHFHGKFVSYGELYRLREYVS